MLQPMGAFPPIAISRVSTEECGIPWRYEICHDAGLHVASANQNDQPPACYQILDFPNWHGI